MFPTLPPPPPPSLQAWRVFIPNVSNSGQIDSGYRTFEVCDEYYCEPTPGFVDEYGVTILQTNDEGLFNRWAADTEPGDVWTGEVIWIGDKFYYCYAVEAWDDLDWQRLELWPQATLVIYLYMDEHYYIGLFEEVVQYKIVQQ